MKGVWNQTINELRAAVPCDLAGERNSVSIMCTRTVRERIITELMRHLDQSFKRLICLSEDRSWSLLAAIALQSSSDYLFYQSCMHQYCAFQPHMWPLSLNPVLTRVKFKGFSLPHTIKLLIWLLLWGSQALYWFLGIEMHSYIFLLWEASCSVHTHWTHCSFLLLVGLKSFETIQIMIFFFSVSQSLLFSPVLKQSVTDVLEYQHTLKCSCHSFVALLPWSSAC